MLDIVSGKYPFDNRILICIFDKNIFDYAYIVNVFWNYYTMYYAPKEHNPPHIHVYYQNEKAIFNITICELMEGELPSKQIRLVLAWIEIHKEELIADWNLCQNGEKPFLLNL